MDTIKASSAVSKKRKMKTKTKVTISEPKNIRVGAKEASSMIELTSGTKNVPVAKTNDKIVNDNALIEEMGEKYPILKDTELVERFLKVEMTNNQKGRIRQAIKESLQGTTNLLVPDIIHNKIQSIIKASPALTAAELRRIRILYNLLKTSLINESATVKAKKKKLKVKKDGDVKIKDEEKKDKVKGQKDGDVKIKGEEKKDKVKGPKRYVVFVGNLPLNVDKEKIMDHFSEMNEHIKDVRIPKASEGKKTAIAYLELSNEPSYEFALSKHHSMMGSRRINVLYTTQKNGKITKGEAKSKAAKLIALQKSGKLVGSIPLSKKRSQRRLKMKKALSKLADK